MSASHPNNKPSIEWYTPLEVIQPFIDLYGTSFLDPCAAKTSPIFRATPYAKVLGIESWDGLTSDWSMVDGEWVFVNPPFGRTIGQWVERVIYEASRSDRPHILLIPARTDAKWFKEAISYPGVVAMLRTGRISFVDAEGVVQKGNSVGTIFLGYNMGEELPCSDILTCLAVLE